MPINKPRLKGTDGVSLHFSLENDISIYIYESAHLKISVQRTLSVHKRLLHGICSLAATAVPTDETALRHKG